MIEDWLRRSASRASERTIDEATTAYYASLRPDLAAEDDAISRAMSRATKDVAAVNPRRRRPR